MKIHRGASLPALAACLALRLSRQTATAQKRTTQTRTATRANASPKKPWTSRAGHRPVPTALGAAARGSALASHTRGGEWGAIIVSLTRGDTLFVAERRRHDAARVDDEDVHVGRRARSASGPTTHSARQRCATAGRRRRDARGQSLSARRRRSVAQPALLARRRADGRVGEGDRGGRHQARSRRHRRRRHARSTTSWFPTAGRRATSAPRMRRAFRRCRSNENLVWVAVRPDGGKAAVTLEPATTAIPVESTVRLVGGSGGHISAARRADGAIVVRGTIGAQFGATQVLARRRQSGAVHDRRAARRAAESRASRRRPDAPRPTPASAVEVAALSSPPLAQIIGEMDRESINIVAELLFRATAHAATNQIGVRRNGSRAPARAHVEEGRNVADGRRTSATAAACRSSIASRRARWCSCSATCTEPTGVRRFTPRCRSTANRERSSAARSGTPARGNLHAKTGTTNTVAALGGYVTAKNGEVLAFSLIYNGNDRGNAKAAMDQIGSNDGGLRSRVATQNGVRHAPHSVCRRTSPRVVRRVYDSLISIPRFRSASM